jgi:hypothetical protein
MKTLWSVCKAFLLLLVLNACDIGDDEVNYHFVTLEIIEVSMPESFTLNETYEIGVTVLVPNGCTQFEGFDVVSGDTTVRNVVAIGTERVDLACAEVISEVEASFDFLCLYPETYLFRFWTGEDDQGVPQYLEIEVPVVVP